MKFRRIALVAAILGTGLFFTAQSSHGSTSTPAPTGLPLYQFINSGSGPLPWNAVSLEGAINNTTMLGGPHAASNASGGALAYRTKSSDIALYTQTLSGTSAWTDLSTQTAAPTPGADPVPFFDPSGGVDVLYVSQSGHLILMSVNDPASALWLHTDSGAAWRPWVSTDLTELTGVSPANGLASVTVNGQSAAVIVRTIANSIAVIPIAWNTSRPVPFVAGAALNVTALTGTGVATSDPVAVSNTVTSFVTTSSSGHLELFVDNASTPVTTTSTTTVNVPSATGWTVLDLSAPTGVAGLVGPLATASNATSVFIAALSNGNAELFSAPLSVLSTGTSTTTPTWNVTNVTSAATGSPPISGSLFLYASASQVTIAGPAANWGDLFALSSVSGYAPWSSTDVSVTAGSAARTVGAVVTGMQTSTGLDLFAAGVNSSPPQGVGVYAIPNNKWSQAVGDGWPILSETGGLGTLASPWVGFVSAQSVATSPDFLMGQSIYNAHKRVTWLSFWTVSGPVNGEVQQPSTYLRNGFAAGAWVATQIAQYRSLGVGLKPDWVIFDPEGYPDNHSGLDAPGGSNPATLNTYASYWTAMLKGWVQGVASVDPTLNAGVYATQSEYRNYGLAHQTLPVFIALAFGGGGPLPIGGATGSNIRGYIAFSAVCSPPTSLKSEESTLLSPPWAGQFNTLQFNAGVYCPPA